MFFWFLDALVKKCCNLINMRDITKLYKKMREVAGTGGSSFYSPETDGNDEGCVGGNSGSSFYSPRKKYFKRPKKMLTRKKTASNAFKCSIFLALYFYMILFFHCRCSVLYIYMCIIWIGLWKDSVPMIVWETHGEIDDITRLYYKALNCVVI